MKALLKNIIGYLFISVSLYLLFDLADRLEPHGARGISAFLLGWIFLRLPARVPPPTSKEGAV
jgi:hypothetical protein